MTQEDIGHKIIVAINRSPGRLRREESIMNKIRIITDSSCDLNKELVDKYNVTIVPLNVSFGDDTYIDGQIDEEEFYRRMSGSKEFM